MEIRCDYLNLVEAHLREHIGTIVLGLISRLRSYYKHIEPTEPVSNLLLVVYAFCCKTTAKSGDKFFYNQKINFLTDFSMKYLFKERNLQ